MDIVSEYLKFRDEKYFRIDGSTISDDRMNYVRAFNSQDLKDDESIFIFLLSTHACALGLNLCGADTVILFDSDWNPQIDLQAQARVHRIGQETEVRVFRLISEHSIEETIFEKAKNKLALEHEAIECGKFDFTMDAREKRTFLENAFKENLKFENICASDIERTKVMFPFM